MRNKKSFIIVGLFVAAAVLMGLLYYYKIQTTWVESPPYKKMSGTPARALVAVYSLTGNTLWAAKEVARFFDADFLQIAAPRYTRTIRGQMRASRDADRELTTTPIQHDPVNISNYELIFLCSPTWWFRPAPPLWSFVENHDFAGKAVFLLLTGNSRFKEELVGKFGKLVEERNGKYLGSLFIRRGRIYWQKSPHEVIEEVRGALKSRQNIWPAKAGHD